MNILIRADSSSQIGTGHIMRDLVLARQLRAQYPHSTVIFATMELLGNINQRIIEAGYPCVTLKDDTRETLDVIIVQHQIDLMVIDHYGIDSDYECWIKTQHPMLTLLCVDDTYELHHCDILLNPNVYADEVRYKGIVPEHCELRCGAQYALLRDEFKFEKQQVREKNTIFVGMGGTDPDNVTLEVLKVLDSVVPVAINVVTSTANQNLDVLKDFIATRPQINLHINTTQVARLMNQACLAIVAPSVILNELLYLSVPFIAIQIADNQREMVSYLTKQHKTVLCGFKKEDFTKAVHSKLNEYVSLISFTELSLKEKEEILRWRNHPSIRRWMYTTEEVMLSQHLEFIELLKNRTDKLYFMVKWFDTPIGVIDLNEITPESCLLGLYADPNSQLRGIGKLLMNQIIRYAFDELYVSVLRLEVFAENERAIKLYQNLGFNPSGEKIVNQKHVLCMELNNENRNI